MDVGVRLHIKSNNTVIEDVIEVPDGLVVGLSEKEKDRVISECVENWSVNHAVLKWEEIKQTKKHSMKVRELIKLLMEEDMDKEVCITLPCSSDLLSIVGYVESDDEDEESGVLLVASKRN